MITKLTKAQALLLAAFFTPAIATASAVPGPDISVYPTDPIDFGTVSMVQGPGYEQSFFLGNNGTTELVFGETWGIAIYGHDAADFQIVNAPSREPLQPGETREVKVIFAPRTQGSKSASLKIETSDPDESIVWVELSGNGANQAPQVANDFWFTPEDTLLAVPAPGFLGNDVDPDGVPRALFIDFLSKSADGTMEEDPQGGFTYMPAPDFNGQDVFAYRIHDGFDASADTGLIEFQVGSIIDPPSLRFVSTQLAGPTNSRAVAVELGTPQMPDPPRVVEFSESPDFSSVSTVPYSGQTTAVYTLAGGGDGERAVYVRLRNDGGTSPARSTSVVLDETAPAVDPAAPLATESAASLDPSRVDLLVSVGFTEPVYTRSAGGSIPGLGSEAVVLGGSVDTSGLSATPVALKGASGGRALVRIAGSVPGSGTLTVGFRDGALVDQAGNALVPPQRLSISLSSSVADWQVLD